MSIRDKSDIQSLMERAKRHRINHVGTKLNEAELKAFEALCERREQTPSELIRTLIQRELHSEDAGAVPSPELVQIEAVRLLLINLLRPLIVQGEQMPEKTWDGFIAKIGELKHITAGDFLRKYQTKKSSQKS